MILTVSMGFVIMITFAKKCVLLTCDNFLFIFSNLTEKLATNKKVAFLGN